MKTNTLILLISAALLAGCQVPSTSIRYDRATGALRIKSPKDVTIGSVVADVGTNGLARLTVTHYAATNNAAVLEAVAAANAAMLRTLADTTTKALSKTP